LGKNNFLDGLFPPKYNFYAMLREQAEITARGVKTLLAWLGDFSPESYDLLRDLALQADNVRMDMEEKLIEAFTTPFDRRDIYYISVQMDRIIEYGRYALQSVIEFAVIPDETIIKMVNELNMGMFELAQAVDLLEEKPGLVQKKIEKIRKAKNAIDNIYKRHGQSFSNGRFHHCHEVSRSVFPAQRGCNLSGIHGGCFT